MPQIVTSLDIDAPPQVVWNALVDQPRYDEWNRLFRILRGKLEKGSFILAKIDAEGIPFVFDARISRFEPERCLAWKGPSVSFLHAIATGEHSFELIDLGGGRTRLVHSERFDGLLLSVEALWSKLEPKLDKLYSGFNQTLKRRAESLANRS